MEIIKSRLLRISFIFKVFLLTIFFLLVITSFGQNIVDQQSAAYESGSGNKLPTSVSASGSSPVMNQLKKIYDQVLTVSYTTELKRSYNIDGMRSRAQIPTGSEHKDTKPSNRSTSSGNQSSKATSKNPQTNQYQTLQLKPASQSASQSGYDRVGGHTYDKVPPAKSGYDAVNTPLGGSQRSSNQYQNIQNKPAYESTRQPLNGGTRSNTYGDVPNKPAQSTAKGYESVNQPLGGSSSATQGGQRATRGYESVNQPLGGNTYNQVPGKQYQSTGGNQYQTLPKKPAGAPDNQIGSNRGNNYNTAPPGGQRANRGYETMSQPLGGGNQYNQVIGRNYQSTGGNQYQTLPKKPAGTPNTGQYVKAPKAPSKSPNTGQYVKAPKAPSSSGSKPSNSRNKVPSVGAKPSKGKVPTLTPTNNSGSNTGKPKPKPRRR